jgi:hypothetical protein
MVSPLSLHPDKEAASPYEMSGNFYHFDMVQYPECAAVLMCGQSYVSSGSATLTLMAMQSMLSVNESEPNKSTHFATCIVS